MHALQILDEKNVATMTTDSIVFAEDSVLPGVADGELKSWAERIADRHHEITNEMEHNVLKNDLIEHIWAVYGRDTEL